MMKRLQRSMAHTFRVCAFAAAFVATAYGQDSAFVNPEVESATRDIATMTARSLSDLHASGKVVLLADRPGLPAWFGQYTGPFFNDLSDNRPKTIDLVAFSTTVGVGQEGRAKRRSCSAAGRMAFHTDPELIGILCIDFTRESAEVVTIRSQLIEQRVWLRPSAEHEITIKRSDGVVQFPRRSSAAVAVGSSLVLAGTTLSAYTYYAFLQDRSAVHGDGQVSWNDPGVLPNTIGGVLVVAGVGTLGFQEISFRLRRRDTLALSVSPTIEGQGIALGVDGEW